MTTKTNQTNQPTNWHFNWGRGGYNTVRATSRRDAETQADKLSNLDLGGVVNLTHDPDYVLTKESDKVGAMMFW
jgi:hypothetical protein